MVVVLDVVAFVTDSLDAVVLVVITVAGLGTVMTP